jgi:hypothetical protein
MSNGDTVFTSPNGLFTLSVTDNGISLAGPGSSVTLDSAGAVTVTTAGGAVAVSSGSGVSVQAGGSSVDVGPGVVSVQATSISLNGGSQPVARVGDLVTGSPGSGTGTIQNGNPTVLA